MVCQSVHAATTGGFINNRNLLLILPEAGSPGLACHRGQMRVLFEPHTPHCILVWWKGLGAPWVSEGTNPIQEGSPLWPNHFPKTTPPNIITLGIRVLTYEFGGDANIQLIAEGYVCQIEYAVLKGEKEP